jgi:hypothetical protein
MRLAGNFKVTRVLPIRIVLCILWLFAVGAGFALMVNYQNADGSVGRIPERWPEGSELALDASRDTLIMFAHPRCPCTRASMEELNRLLARSGGKATTHVVFFKPKGFSEDWAKTDLWRSAAAIPGVTVHEDLDGAQAHLFGAETSGQVLLYNPHGQLLFRGGITGSRGHAGDNTGEDEVVSLLAGRETRQSPTQVYGCSLGSCPVPTAGAAK